MGHAHAVHLDHQVIGQVKLHVGIKILIDIIYAPCVPKPGFRMPVGVITEMDIPELIRAEESLHDVRKV